MRAELKSGELRLSVSRDARGDHAQASEPLATPNAIPYMMLDCLDP